MYIRILLITVDNNIQHFIETSFKNTAVIVVAADVETCIIQIRQFQPQIIMIYQDEKISILSIIGIIHKIRAAKIINPLVVAVLTTLKDADFSSSVLDSGADDVICLPVSEKLLLNQTKALLRQTLGGFKNRKILEFGNLIISAESYSVKFNNKEFSLPKKELHLLLLLASIPGRVFTKKIILKSIWEEGIIVDDKTIDVHVTKIRKRLKLDCIQAVKRVGYKFVIPV